MLSNIEIKEIEVESPIDSLNIGDEYFYSGTYVHGYHEGTSKIIRFYKEVIFIDGVDNSLTDIVPYWMELENGKLILLGMVKNKGEFEIAESFKLKNNPPM